MAFLVEDGTGLAAANAYITATEGRAYWSEQGVVFTQSDSAGAGVASLQTAIVAATRYIETRFRARFKGEIQFPPASDGSFAGQALSFPRLCLYDVNGYPVTGIPRLLKYATAEYMKRALTADLLPDPTQSGNLIMNREQVGPLETEQQFSPGSVQIIFPYPAADFLLDEFIYSGNYCIR
jgi:DnaT-like ssDNA binding protein